MQNLELLSRWLEESPENRRAFQEERLILAATEAIYKAMEMRGISKAALAERLGSSKAHISQLLNGSRNMTLRTFARIAFSLDVAPILDLKGSESVEHVEQVSIASVDYWDSEKIANYSRRPMAPAVLVHRPSAEWTGHEHYKDAA